MEYSDWLYITIPIYLTTWVLAMHAWWENDEDSWVGPLSITIVGHFILAAFVGVVYIIVEALIRNFSYKLLYVIAGIVIPIGIYALIHYLMNFLKSIPQSTISKIKAHELPKGNYQDIAYVEPVRRTVAEIIEN